ncbi:MAG: PaaI family thioesterase [Haloarculaceae archaeon]
MSEDETRSVEVSLSAEEYDRMQALGEDPATLLREAAQSELRVRESIEAIETRRQGGADEPLGLPGTGPLDSPVGALLGFEVDEIGDGEAVLSMAAGRRHANRGGPVQGGVITALADTATAFAFMTTLDEGASTTNVELKMNFLRPVFEDRIEATARVVERGRTLGLVECDVRTTEGKLVARMSTTYMVLRGDHAEGR